MKQGGAVLPRLVEVMVVVMMVMLARAWKKRRILSPVTGIIARRGRHLDEDFGRRPEDESGSLERGGGHGTGGHAHQA